MFVEDFLILFLITLGDIITNSGIKCCHLIFQGNAFHSVLSVVRISEESGGLLPFVSLPAFYQIHEMPRFIFFL